jgi:phosphate transport system substrate-binding protein
MQIKNLVQKSLILFTITSFLYANSIQVKGSDTIVNLGQKLAEEYGKINKNVNISVTGGGSGTGIASLINNEVDIANASRIMKPKEIANAKKNGVEAKEFIVAIDALTVIVHPRNKVEKLTLEQIGKIFKGEISNWKDVGGEDRPINLYGRQSNSGTFVFFREAVLKGDYSNKMNRMNGTSQIVESVRNDLSGIGYVGVSSVYRKGRGPVDFVKSVLLSSKGGFLGLQDVAYSGFNKSDVYSGIYPLTRGLNMYTNGKPTGEVKKYMEFILSDVGQKIVDDIGFYPVGPKEKAANTANL